MIRILQRGGIHRTKFEFGLFNRKHKPKHNKKRALIVHRGVYSVTARLFACGGRPTHVRKMKDLRKPPILQRQGLKRLSRVMSRSLREVSQREGFVRRLLTPASDPCVGLGEQFVAQAVESGTREGFLRQLFDTEPKGQLFSPEVVRKATEGPVPHHEVDFVDEKFCFLDILEPEMILKLYEDIVGRMPSGLIPQNGDFLSFDPDATEGETGSRVRMHHGKIVEVQRMSTKWVGPYAVPQDTSEKRKGWNIWELKGLPFNKTMKVKVDTGGRTLEPGEAIICNPDGTYSPFKGASITMRSETGGDDFIEVLRGVFSVPKELVDDKPKHQSIGYIPKGKITLSELRNLEPVPSTSEWQLPPATPVPGRTVEHINETTNLITDSFREPNPESVKASRGWELVEFIDVKLASGPREVQEGDVERKTSETVNKTDIDKEPNNG